MWLEGSSPCAEQFFNATFWKNLKGNTTWIGWLHFDSEEVSLWLTLLHCQSAQNEWQQNPKWHYLEFYDIGERTTFPTFNPDQ